MPALKLIEAVCAVLLVLVATNAGISPVPLAARPIDVLEFVQLTVAPVLAGTPDVIAGTVVPAHRVLLDTTFITGLGNTVIVYIIPVPEQALDALIAMVAVMGALLLFTAVKEGTSPVPLAAKPMAGLLLNQVTVAPLVAGMPEETAATGVPVQTVLLATWLNTIFGNTVIENPVPALEHPLLPCTTMNAVNGVAVLFTGTKAGIDPVPLAGRPIEGLLFVQLTATPATGATTTGMLPVGIPAHNVLAAIALMRTFGLTVIVKTCPVPLQPLLADIMIVAIIAVSELFAATNAGRLPVPLAGRPMAGLLLVQFTMVPGSVPVPKLILLTG